VPGSIDSAVHVIIAARDEAGTIAETVHALRGALPGATLIVADDCSSDHTAEIAAAGGALVVRGERHRGKGAAVSAAAARAMELAAASDVVARPGLAPATGMAPDPCVTFLLCDGDLGSSAAELGALVQAVEAGHADLAVGVFAERHGGGFGVARAYARRAIHRLCGRELTAPMSGQRALSAHALATLLPFSDGYGMELGMSIDALRAGLRVSELELSLTHRAYGRTPAGFAHRALQLLHMVRAARQRRH
jgi:glycosyltransferase involved in cell wall biosynthesis